MAQLVPLPDGIELFLANYLPIPSNKLFLTLTYASSLDSRISAGVGLQTVISHLETKTMTHYIRSKHDGILVGIGTVLADDPGLNCRFEGGTNPRPIVIDPEFRWNYIGSRMDRTYLSGKGKSPYILVNEGLEVEEERVTYVRKHGGDIIFVPLNERRQMDWSVIAALLYEKGINSLMVEGGARIINDLLAYKKANGGSIVDSLIVTIGPVYLGDQGVEVSPSKGVKLREVEWFRGVTDCVLAGRVE